MERIRSDSIFRRPARVAWQGERKSSLTLILPDASRHPCQPEAKIESDLTLVDGGDAYETTLAPYLPTSSRPLAKRSIEYGPMGKSVGIPSAAWATRRPTIGDSLKPCPGKP